MVFSLVVLLFSDTTDDKVILREDQEVYFTYIRINNILQSYLVQSIAPSILTNSNVLISHTATLVQNICLFTLEEKTAWPVINIFPLSNFLSQ